MSKAGQEKLSGSGLFWAVTYSVISVAITLFNKAVLSSFGFSSAMTLTLLQGVVTVLGCEAMKWGGSPQLQYPNLNWVTVLQVAPLSFVFIAYVVISLMSLERVNVPMFTALRRLTIVFVMVEEYFLLSRSPSRLITYSVLVMCLGAAIAAWKDLTFDPVSYFYLFLTNLFTSLYTVYITKVRKDTNLNPIGMLFYCNVSSMPVLFLLAWYSGDIAKAWAFPRMGELFFQINFQASIFLAFLMNVSVFYCTSLNSARTQTVVGQLKNFVAFLLGLVLFDDYIYDPINMLGLWVGLAGGVWYAYIESVEKAKAPVLLPLSTAGAPVSLAAAGSAGTAATAANQDAGASVAVVAGGSAGSAAAPGDESSEGLLTDDSRKRRA